MEKENKDILRIRLVFVLGFFGLSIGNAFNNLYARQMAKMIPETRDTEIYTALPMLFLMCMMLLGVLLSGQIARRVRAFDSYMRVSVLIVLFGMLVRGLSFRYWILLVGSSLHGFGYGCMFIGIRYYAYLFSKQENVHVLAFVNSGSFVGSCMGTIIGGMLSGSLSYRAVYLAAAAFMLLPLLLIRKSSNSVFLTVGKLKDILKVFRNKKTLLLSIFIVLPLYSCAAFTDYIVPLDVDDFGYSATVISAMLLGQSMLTAYLGPTMTRFMTKKVPRNVQIVLFCLMYAVPIALYSLIGGMPFLILTMVFLGIADSFGLNVLTDVFVQARGDGDYDDNTALIAYLLVTRTGMSLAPVTVMIFPKPIWFSVLVMAGLLLFFMSCALGRTDGKMKEQR